MGTRTEVQLYAILDYLGCTLTTDDETDQILKYISAMKMDAGCIKADIIASKLEFWLKKPHTYLLKQGNDIIHVTNELKAIMNKDAKSTLDKFTRDTNMIPWKKFSREHKDFHKEQLIDLIKKNAINPDDDVSYFIAKQMNIMLIAADEDFQQDLYPHQIESLRQIQDFRKKLIEKKIKQGTYPFFWLNDKDYNEENMKEL